MAAYGLYTHIAANKTRSMLLLAGLFALVYVVVYACALIIEVFNYAGAPADYYLWAALHDLIRSLPYSTGAAALWILIAYFFHQSIIDAVTGGATVTRREQPRLYNLLENLCISRGISIGRADQESRRHDLGAAQDRGPRRACRRDVGGDGALRG
jgi:heat shock protein HtpX